MTRFALILSLLFIFPCLNLQGQQTVVIDGLTIPSNRTIDGELVPNWVIPEIVVFPKRTFKSKKDYRQYQRMIHNLKVVYPYAQIAKNMLNEVDEELKTKKSEHEKKVYIDQVEKDMREQFEKQLVKLTVTQGKMLIKLIDRETGQTSYQLVKELKGNFAAAFWQAVARIFGSNLKSEFDCEGEDKILNELIVLYEHQQL